MKNKVFKCRCCNMSTLVENSELYKTADAKDVKIRELQAKKAGGVFTHITALTVAMTTAAVTSDMLEDDVDMPFIDYISRLALVGVGSYLVTRLLTASKWRKFAEDLYKSNTVLGYCNECHLKFVEPYVIDLN